MISLHTAPLTEADARTVCGWHYEGEYAVYNSEWDTVVSGHWAIANAEKRRREFYSLRNDAEALIGFFRLQEQEGFVLISLGLAPEHCGQGLGKAAMALILDEARRTAPGKRPELEVRAFNKRAIACYERCGFSIIDTYYKETPVGGDMFIRMALRL
ncbi:MAG: GNAT family N-acetyltransferase [Bacillota bacterium]